MDQRFTSDGQEGLRATRVVRINQLLDEATASFASVTAGAKRKQNPGHNRLSRAGAFGVFRNVKTFLQRHNNEGVGVLQWHKPTDRAESPDQRQGLAKRRLFGRREERSAQSGFPSHRLQNSTEPTRKGDRLHYRGSGPGNYIVVPVRIQIHERDGKFGRGIGLSILTAPSAGHRGERENRS